VHVCSECYGNFIGLECRDCAEGSAGDNCDSGCLNGTIIDNECTCLRGWGLADDGESCSRNPCIRGCNLCDLDLGGEDMTMTRCLECDPNYFDVGRIDSEYTLCSTMCPSGYIGEGCEPPTGRGPPITSYNFNAPRPSFPNLGSAAIQDITDAFLVDNGTSGIPAKNRGIHISPGRPGYIATPGLLLSHTFSVHSWVLQKQKGTMTLFNKSRVVILGLDIQNRPYVEIKTDFSGYAESTIRLELGEYVWNYLVFSIELQLNQSTEVTWYLNNNFFDSKIVDYPQVIDGSIFPACIGASLQTNGSQSDMWNGFIYNFNLYLYKHDVAFTDLFLSGCGTGDCWTADINFYEDEEGEE
jgi:hypothetical protein